jgi:hypothetical protein
MEFASCHDSSATMFASSIFLGVTAVFIVLAAVAAARLISGFADPVGQAQPA